MNNPLPAEELRTILGQNGFLRLYGRDQFLYVSDAPRRVPGETLERLRQTMRDQGFLSQVDPSDLLLIDLQPARWRALLDTFQPGEPGMFPAGERLWDVYALARLLKRHPADFAAQPMEMIRAVFKGYARKDGLPALVPGLLSRCAERLRRGLPLPSALSGVLMTWLSEYKVEVRT